MEATSELIITAAIITVTWGSFVGAVRYVRRVSQGTAHKHR